MLVDEVATIRAAQDGCCTYCHRRFGSLVTWHGRNVFLSEEREHVMPRCVGGRLTVPACSLCNRIKGSKVFESFAEIQTYCLERLVRDGSLTVVEAHAVKVEVAVRRESVDQADVTALFPNEQDSSIQLVDVTPLDEPRGHDLRRARGWLKIGRHNEYTS